MRLLGTDEAGFGPNLGPLVIAATRWDGPAGDTDELRSLLAEVASETRCDGLLQLADSKAVHVAGASTNEGPLAQAARGILRAAGVDSTSLVALAAAVNPQGESPLAGLPLYDDDDRAPDSGDECVDRFVAAVAEAGLSVTVRADVLPAAAYNDLLDRYGSKGQLLSRRTLALLATLWRPGEPAAIVCDKHGGRDKYAELLTDCLTTLPTTDDGGAIFAGSPDLFGPRVDTLAESRRQSRYRIGDSTIAFAQAAESHLPVACASLVAKWIRERAMEAFNRYWATHAPAVRPTRGYPSDAARWRADVGEAAIEAFGERSLWRRK